MAPGIPLICTPNVGLTGLKNSCLRKVFPETQKENVLLVQYKSKLMFKAEIVDPSSMKQQIFITWGTEKGTACQIRPWKICLQEHVIVHIEEEPIFGKGVSPEGFIHLF